MAEEKTYVNLLKGRGEKLVSSMTNKFECKFSGNDS